MEKKSFHFEVSLTDTDRQKRRLVFYGAQYYLYSKDNIHRQVTHTRIPTAYIMEDIWMNLQFDFSTFLPKCFGNEVAFASIDSITFGGHCLVRRVLSTKHQVPDSFPYVIEKDFGEDIAVDFENYVHGERSQAQVETLEKNFNFAIGVDHMNQVITFERLIYFGYIQEQARDPAI